MEGRLRNSHLEKVLKLLLFVEGKPCKVLKRCGSCMLISSVPTLELFLVVAGEFTLQLTTCSAIPRIE